MPTPPQMYPEEFPWQTMMDKLEDVRAEVRGGFEEVWENITNLRSELKVVPYERRRKSTTTRPQRGPVINPEAAELRAAMEISRREHEERMRAELNPKGKVSSAEDVHEPSDED